MWDFKKFEGGSSTNRESAIVINKPNSIGFSSRFYQDNNVSEFKYVILYFDSANRAIGIKLTNKEEEKTKYSINHAKKGFGAQVVPKSFFKENKRDTEKCSGRYEFEEEKIEGIGDIFIITLKDKSVE